MIKRPRTFDEIRRDEGHDKKENADAWQFIIAVYIFLACLFIGALWLIIYVATHLQ